MTNTETTLTAVEVAELPSKSRAAYRACMRICLELEQCALASDERNELVRKAQAKRDLLSKHTREHDVGSPALELINRAWTDLNNTIIAARELCGANFVESNNREIARLTVEIRTANAETAWMRR